MAIKFEANRAPVPAAKPLPSAETKPPVPAVSSPPLKEAPRAKRKTAKVPIDPADDLLTKR